MFGRTVEGNKAHSRSDTRSDVSVTRARVYSNLHYADDAFRASDGLGGAADGPEHHCLPKPLEVTQTVADGFPFRVAATVGSRLH